MSTYAKDASHKPGVSVQQLAFCGLFAALTAVCSQIQIPLPMIPINLALLAVHLAGGLMKKRYALLSMAAYVLLGLVGVPVFAGFQAGAGVLLGKTGGYILGYILSAFLTAWLMEKWPKTFWRLCLAMLLGVMACYAFGTAWFMIISGLSLGVSLGYCVLPFLPGDAVKIALAALLVLRLDKPLGRLMR